MIISSQISTSIVNELNKRSSCFIYRTVRLRRRVSTIAIRDERDRPCACKPHTVRLANQFCTEGVWGLLTFQCRENRVFSCGHSGDSMRLQHLPLHALLIAQLGALVREGEWRLANEREHDLGLVTYTQHNRSAHHLFKHTYSVYTYLHEYPG